MGEGGRGMRRHCRFDNNEKWVEEEEEVGRSVALTILSLICSAFQGISRGSPVSLPLSPTDDRHKTFVRRVRRVPRPNDPEQNSAVP